MYCPHPIGMNENSVLLFNDFQYHICHIWRKVTLSKCFYKFSLTEYKNNSMFHYYKRNLIYSIVKSVLISTSIFKNCVITVSNISSNYGNVLEVCHFSLR